MPIWSETELKRRFHAACDTMDDLSEQLELLYQISPSLFSKPIKEMGASEKLKTTKDIFELLASRGNE